VAEADQAEALAVLGALEQAGLHGVLAEDELDVRVVGDGAGERLQQPWAVESLSAYIHRHGLNHSYDRTYL
jgi:hypothetical protein